MSGAEQPRRHVVVVDVETNGLDPERHQAVEVAWHNLSTDERGCFVPVHDVHAVLEAADIKALQLNRYVDRIATAPQDNDGTEVRRLAEILDGSVLAGANPSFDAAFLRAMFDKCWRSGLLTIATAEPQWHYRMLDLGSYAAGVLGHNPAEPLGLRDVADLVKSPVMPDHCARMDVAAAVLCFRWLFTRAGVTTL